MTYKIAYYTMLISFLYISIHGGTPKKKAIGFILTIAKGLIFYK